MFPLKYNNTERIPEGDLLVRTMQKKEQIYDLLKSRIQDGTYAEGNFLPKEVEFASELGVARKTLRSALERLSLENFIKRVKGAGTFVCSRDSDQPKILVILPHFNDITEVGQYILPGILQEGKEMQLAVETCTCTSLLSDTIGFTVKKILARNYCGILCILSNFIGNEPLLAILKRTRLPVLLPHATPRDSAITGFAVMGTDYRKLIRDSLHYLAELGCRRVAYLDYQEQRIDKKNYFRLVREEGLDDNPNLREESDSYNDKKIIRNAMTHLLQANEKPPTAVLCFSDYFAMCVSEYLQEKGYRIPNDMAVLSIGGLIGCDFLNPPLSAMNFDSLEIGKRAVRVLMEMVQKKQFFLPFIVTPHYLTERESTKILPQRKKATIPMESVIK